LNNSVTESSSQLQIDSDQMQVDSKAQTDGAGGNSSDDDCQLLIADNKSEIKQDETEGNAPVPAPNAVPAPPPPPVAPKLTRTERERLYKLPSAPHLVVHPSSKAKAGKFDCQLVSLSHMLDYRKDDNKECSFECFLFAECFNEMIIRDQGFTIYKHLLTLRDEPNSTTTQNSQNKRKLSVANNESNGAKEEATGESNETKKLKTSDSTASPAEASTATPAGEQTEASVSLSETNKSTTNVIKLKPKTVHPDLLLAFTYMDTHRSGYIHEKDLEDFLLLLGLNLTRSKVRALIKRLNVRDSLINYRALTDAYSSASSASSLAANVFYKLPSDDEFIKNLISFDAYMNRLIKSDGSGDAGGDRADNLIVEMDGQAIDVMKTVAKLETSESNLLKLDLKLKESLDEIGKNMKLFLRCAINMQIALFDCSKNFFAGFLTIQNR
jgi:hypothetical protein